MRNVTYICDVCKKPITGSTKVVVAVSRLSYDWELDLHWSCWDKLMKDLGKNAS